MKNIEKIKFIFGITLTSFAVLAGLVFYLESFYILDYVFSSKVSLIFDGGWVQDSGGGTSQAPVFLGLCGLSGAYLLASINNVS